MIRLSRFARGAARGIASLPLRLIGKQLRAQALETLTNEMITSTLVPGGCLRFHTPSTLLLSRASSVLSKEPETIAWLNGVDPGAVLWDIGANVGVYGLYAATCRHCTVLAFEPSAPNFHVLCRNIQLNNLCDRVTAYCIALSGMTRLGVLNLESSAVGAAINQFGDSGEMSPYSQTGQAEQAHGAVGLTIDDFINRFDPPFPNFIKLDVDGLELDILQGAQKTLHDPRLTSVLVELSVTQAGQNQGASGLLDQAGFKVVSQGAVQGTGRESAANHLFERHAPLIQEPQPHSRV